MKYIYTKFIKILIYFFGIIKAKEIDALIRFKKRIDIENPKKLSEKLCYLELVDFDDKTIICTDKIGVRSYLRKMGFEKYLIPIVAGPCESTKEIVYDSLPKSFVIKANHGCRMNYIVKDKDTNDVEHMFATLDKWLNTTYGEYSIEPHYSKIKPLIYAEEMLMDRNLKDYKIFCMNGIPRFIEVCFNRIDNKSEGMKVNLALYDFDWKRIDGVTEKYHSKEEIDKPDVLDKMYSIARDISKDFKFVRVDLYYCNNQIYIGELTFTPACCYLANLTNEFDTKMGEYLSI